MGTDERGSILSGTGAMIDMRLLNRITERPTLYSNREEIFWADPYISDHVLNAHLDPETDVASRKPDAVQATIAFLAGVVSGRSALDLGCGPGLYAEELASREFSVTGIDVSPASLLYARARAAALGLPCTYHAGDFRSCDLGGPYDLAFQAYGELGTIPTDELRKVLNRTREALRPGGLLAFDVFTREYVDRIRSGNEWYLSVEDGFWQEAPHMVIEQTFRYEEHSASVARYTVVNEDGSFRQFSVWWRHYLPDEIRTVVEQCGFVDVELFGSMWGDTPGGHDEWIAVLARRPAT